MKTSYLFLGLAANYAAFVSAGVAGFHGFNDIDTLRSDYKNAFVDKYKRSDEVQIDTKIPLYSKLTPDCLNEIKSSAVYKECLYRIGFNDISTLRNECKKVFDDKCKKFYEDPILSLPKCTNDPVMKEYNEYLKDIALDINTYYCSVNEVDSTCPSAVFIIDNPNAYSERFMEDCPYKICIDKQIKYLENQKKYSSFNNKYFIGDSTYDEVAENRYYDYIINKLKTQECTSQIKYNNNNTNTTKLITDVPEKTSSTSDATSIRVFSSLLSLLLVYIFF